MESMPAFEPETEAGADASAALCRPTPVLVCDNDLQPDILPDAVAHAVAVVEAERDALHRLTRALTNGCAPAFERAVSALASCEGRVIVTGMGKSGLIGRKIAATMASTGTLALFVHPAEASHGDLGMIAPKDVVLVLSNSGETPELTVVLGYVARLKVPCIAVTSSPGSTLARRADLVLLLPGAGEACPLGLAPTTSTTMMLALGDALAVALMRRKRFTRSEFLARHPGGRLGTDGDTVMAHMRQPRRLPLVGFDAPLSEVILRMAEAGYTIAGVTDHEGRLVGAIREPEIRRHTGPDLLQLPARQVMSETLVIATAGMSPRDALGLMSALGVSSLFVIEDERPIGILHLDDCRRALGA